jgi:signal transduction histidine kinase
MINKLSDEALLKELKTRFETNRQNMINLTELNKQLLEVNMKLADSEKLKSHFLSNVRNEIINPLSSILSLSSNIAGISLSKEEMQKQARIIFNEAFVLNFQLANILSSAEIEAGESKLEIYNVEIGELTRSVVQKLTSYAQNKKIELVFDRQISDDVIGRNFRSDPSKLRLILENLILNAINWSHSNSQVTVRLYEQENMVQLQVSDDGIGIKKEDQEVIFDRFIQLDQRIFTDNPGHGLGLSIVKAYCEILDGSISVESEPGKGSTFTIWIPNTTELVRSEGFSHDGQDFLFEEGDVF